METRFLLRAAQRIARPSSIKPIQTRLQSCKIPPPTQAIPVGGYYSSMLDSPSTYASASKPTITILPPSEPHTPNLPPPKPKPREAFSTKSTTSDEEPAIIFSPRTVKKWEDRKEDLTSKYATIARVKVPEKPTEPDNCCMAGCVNCVWDLYGEELEVWSAAKREADVRLAKESGKKGERSGWGLGGEDGEELLSGIDVGIREFMKVERMLKEKQGKVG